MIFNLKKKEIEKQAIGEDPKAAVAAKMPKPLNKIIAEHKDVNKLVISLNTSMSSFKEEVQDVLRNFTGFSELWEKEPEPSVKDFMATKPLMVDLEAKFRHYKVEWLVHLKSIVRLILILLNLIFRNCKQTSKSFRMSIKLAPSFT